MNTAGLPAPPSTRKTRCRSTRSCRCCQSDNDSSAGGGSAGISEAARCMAGEAAGTNKKKEGKMRERRCREQLPASRSINTHISDQHTHGSTTERNCRRLGRSTHTRQKTTPITSPQLRSPDSCVDTPADRELGPDTRGDHAEGRVEARIPAHRLLL